MGQVLTKNEGFSDFCEGWVPFLLKSSRKLDGWHWPGHISSELHWGTSFDHRFPGITQMTAIAPLLHILPLPGPVETRPNLLKCLLYSHNMTTGRRVVYTSQDFVHQRGWKNQLQPSMCSATLYIFPSSVQETIY